MDNVIVGKNYRFTILSEILIRMEYSETGVFIDDYTELVRNRKRSKALDSATDEIQETTEGEN